MSRLLLVGVLCWAMSVLTIAAPQSPHESASSRRARASALFETSDACFACHNGLTSSSGEDVSISSEWRSTMMANSARDPYWQASVRREVVDHPAAREEIEDECSVCHMPMARTTSMVTGAKGEVFAHLPVAAGADAAARRAHDGVSCTVCHQIGGANFGTAASFTGAYLIDATVAAPRPIFGPFQIDPGHTTIMRSSTGFKPIESVHVQQSELCATCHTLYTTARNAEGQAIGTLPEQMPYLEWKHSSYAATNSCQSCHMPAVDNTPITSVLGEPRRLARHFFRGGNSFMLRLLSRYRGELGVVAPASELDRSAALTVKHLQDDTATIAISRAAIERDRLVVDIAVQNRSGHKLPTGYPSRRAWIHLTVRAASGAVVFESGAVTADGAIVGNDGDTSPAAFEPHYTQIGRADEVQIYESIMGDAQGAPTTGLLSAVRFLKDNRLLPAGFQKAGAPDDIAVVGEAARDDDFTGGEDRVRYAIDPGNGTGPFSVEAELRFQSVAYRWAENLKGYPQAEPQRFTRYYGSMAPASSERLASSTTTVSR